MAGPKLPWVDLALLEYLETLYPDKMPTDISDPFRLGMKAGGVQVTRTLRRLYEEQVKHALGSGSTTARTEKK